MDTQHERLSDRRQREAELKKRYRMDLPFMLLTLILVAIGVVMMFSASYARAFQEEGNSTYYFTRQLVFGIIGIAVMLVAANFNYHYWRIFSLWILGGSVLLLILVLAIGSSAGGAQRWLNLGIFSFQPSEVAKFAVVLTFATLISSFGERMKNHIYGVWPFVGILLVMAGLLLAEPHLSATVIICGVGAAMMFQGGTNLRWFGVLGVFAVIAFIVLVSSGYASERISAWLHPEQDQGDTGYQSVQALYAIGSGGLFGLGFGNSRQKYLYLPEEHNDYVFPIICEELGFVGAMFIIILFIMLILRGYWIAMHAKDRFGALLAGGLTTLLALQVFFNIGVVTGVLPPTGISLPFFSYGGTALVMQLAQMGIILNVSRSCDEALL